MSAEFVCIALLALSLAFVSFCALLGRDWLIACFIILALTSTITAGKLVTAFGQTGSVATPVFGGLLLLTDVINEFYGPAVARKTVWLGLAGNLVLVTFGQLVVGAPPAFETPVTQALAPLFAFAPRLLAGGLLAYVISQFTDVWLFFSLRRAFNDKHLWLRTAGSTAISQAIDTVVVYMIAFSGSVPDLPAVMWGAWSMKLVVAAVSVPAIYATRAAVRARKVVT